MINFVKIFSFLTKKIKETNNYIDLTNKPIDLKDLVDLYYKCSNCGTSNKNVNYSDRKCHFDDWESMGWTIYRVVCSECGHIVTNDENIAGHPEKLKNLHKKLIDLKSLPKDLPATYRE